MAPTSPPDCWFLKSGGAEGPWARRAAAGFERRFERRAEVVVRAPGRVNLIGDHTDYCDGLVLPVAIEPAIHVAAAAAPHGDRLRVYSEAMGQAVELPCAGLDRLRPACGSAQDGRPLPSGSRLGCLQGRGSEMDGSDASETGPRTDVLEDLEPWARYLLGVVHGLLSRGVPPVPGCCWIGGDLTPGVGLASSAALDVGFALALLVTSGATLAPLELALLAQEAEHRFAGSPCGIMDPLCCVSARPDTALRIDCRSLAIEHVPARLPGARFLIIDSGVRHAIAGGEYACRRGECAAALEELSRIRPAVRSLRDATPADIAILGERAGGAARSLARRARHVVTENERVEQAVRALRRGEAGRFGALMDESHRSLRDDFEVSCPEVDRIVEGVTSLPGVLGARITGGGFGGCVLALVEDGAQATVRGWAARGDGAGQALWCGTVEPSEGACAIALGG
jgi:galactokinase